MGLCSLGLRSGLARRKGRNEELRPWEDEGIHRAMWYRKRGEGTAARIAARNKSIREDPRINAELASEHGLTVRRIRQIRNQLGGGGEIKVDSNYTDSVLLGLREKEREDFDFLGKTKTFLIGKGLKTKDLRRTAERRTSGSPQNPTQNPG